MRFGMDSRFSASRKITSAAHPDFLPVSEINLQTARVLMPPDEGKNKRISRLNK